MPLLRRPAAWPLVLSLAAHVAVAAWWWREAPPAPRVSPAPARPPMVWLRLSAAPAAAPPAAAPVAPPSHARAKAPTGTRPRPASTPRSEPVAAPAAVAAVPAPLQAEPVPAPVTPVEGVAFGPPRWSLPFGSGGGPAFGRRGATAVAAQAAATAPIDPARMVREQVMRAIEVQLAQWSVPSDPRPAQCRFVAAPDSASTDEPDCDSLALADALTGGRLDSVRESLAVLRRLAPETDRGALGAAFVIAFADGRYRLQTASR